MVDAIEYTTEGQHNWGGVCASGKRQSPINIMVRELCRTARSHHQVQAAEMIFNCTREPLLFTGYNQPLTSFTITNNGFLIGRHTRYIFTSTITQTEFAGFEGDYVHVDCNLGIRHKYKSTAPTLLSGRFPAVVLPVNTGCYRYTFIGVSAAMKAVMRAVDGMVVSMSCRI
jgi:hypothetical protein